MTVSKYTRFVRLNNDVQNLYMCCKMENISMLFFAYCFFQFQFFFSEESTGAQREKLRKSSKNSVCVDISGIQCFVGSQYVSNHEFFEVQFIFYFGTYNMLVM